MDKRDEQLYELGRPLVDGMGYRLVAVDDVIERGRRVFRFYVDHPRGVTVDDCCSVSRELEYLLDADFDFDGPYVLEVSSPGLDHPLRSEREFEYFVGHRVRVVLRESSDGRNVVVGTLVAAGPSGVRVRSEAGDEQTIPMTNIARARLATQD